jgi:hypothetical protein
MKTTINLETAKLIERVKWTALDVLDECGDAFTITIETFGPLDRAVTMIAAQIGTDTVNPIMIHAPLGDDLNHSLRVLLGQIHADAGRLVDLGVRRVKSGKGWIFTKREAGPALEFVGEAEALNNAAKLNAIAARLGVYRVPVDLDATFAHATAEPAAKGAL